ncbi:MAG: hypothetical protein WAL46_06900 [Nitrososphaeraceae archaeon]|jgi:hypothetical protein
MKSITLLIATSALVLSLLTSVGLFVSTSYAQGNQTNATTAGNETGGNQTGNQSNPLGGIGEAIQGMFGGGQ